MLVAGAYRQDCDPLTCISVIKVCTEIACNIQGFILNWLETIGRVGSY